TLVGKVAGPRLVAGSRKIMRPPVERHVKFRIGEARALDDRLVIAGQKALGFAETGDLHWAEIVLEEAARCLLVAWPRRSRAAAALPERVVDRPVVVRLGVAKGLAACLESHECREVIVAHPPLDITPLHRLELAVREFQRLVAQLGTNRTRKPQRGCSDASEEDAQSHRHRVPPRLLPG